jgi:hypothetical protein
VSERQDTTIKTTSGRWLIVTVSDEFQLIKLEDEDGHGIMLDLTDFRLLAKWVEKK